MKTRISIGNWVGVILLTLITIPSLFISLFVFPVEMIAFSNDSYYQFIEDETYRSQMPPVIADVVTKQILLVNGKNLPPVFENKGSFQAILMQYLPDEWMNGVLVELIENTMAYINFKTPYTTIEIGISDLKNAITSNSAAIANEYVQSLENCQESEEFQFDENSSIMEFPPCKPASEDRSILSASVSTYLEDRTLNLPPAINLVGLIPTGMLMGESTFYWYSIIRWVFRLLPFITIFLLIMIAYLLRIAKKQMRKWSGLLLAGVTGITLLGSLVVIIGFDQFVGMVFNQYFSRVIAGFGNILLGIMQEIGNEILLWVIAISAVIFLFGLILLLAARYTKASKQNEDTVDNEQPDPVEENAVKTDLPETLEDIEKKEKENEGS